MKDHTMFSKQLTLRGQARQFCVTTAAASGWEIQVSEGDRVVRRTGYTDWHRLERGMNAIELEIAELEARGWHVSASAGEVGAQSTNR
ncbi:MAG: hypothetical protein ABIP65_02325 [Vicinamibacterales bacterium]